MSAMHRSILVLLFAMTIWGSTFVVTKDLIGHVAPMTLAFMRVAVGALALAPFALARHQRGSRLPWGWLALMAFVGVAFYYATFNLSLLYTTAVQGALVQSCIPVVVAVVAMVWLREHASVARCVGIALSTLGILIVFSGGTSDSAPQALLGNLLMFVTVVSWGAYTSLAKRVAHLDAVVVTAVIAALGAVMLLPLAIVETVAKGWPTLSLLDGLAILYLGAIASGAAYMLYNYALRHMDASQAGVYTNLIPIVGVITGVIVLGEDLTLRAFVGGAIVMLGVWITSRQPAKAAGPAALGTQGN
jgi:drug/metabolite transporter (DMT)-like permease